MGGPVFARVALLGEAGKVTAVSTHRFASVVPAPDALALALRGEPGEQVTLLFATQADDGAGDEYACVAKTVAIGDDGTARASFP